MQNHGEWYSIKSTEFYASLHLCELGGRRRICAVGPVSRVEREVTMGQPDGQLRGQLRVDKNKAKQTLQRQTGTCVSLSSTVTLILR